MAYYPLASAAKKTAAGTKFVSLDSAWLFRLGRMLGMMVLGAIVVVSPELGNHHRDVGWLLMLGWAPLAVVLDLWAEPSQRLPLQTSTDLFAIVVCSAMLPGVWFPALVLGALIIGGSVPRFAISHKFMFALVPTGFIGGMAYVAAHYNIADTWFPLVALSFGAPFCFLFGLKEQRREQELRDRINVMDSLTRMAGGIGHDFNNILTGIQGNAELAEHKLNRNHVARPYLQALMAESQKAQLFSNQLLAFSGGVVTGRARLDLRAELQGIASLLESAMPRGVRLNVETQANLPLVSGNRAQLQEIIVASILHVADSLENRPGGVGVTLRKVARRHGDELVLQARSSSTEDSTAGMSLAARQRGLGGRRFSVPAARRVLREHGGEMDVHGDWRTGLVVTLRIPGLPATQSNGIRPSAPALLVPRHVLLLEAAPRVRAVGQSLLQELGHRVTCALSDDEVLELLTADDSIDLVMLDIALVDARLLLDRIAAVRPGIPALLPDGRLRDSGLDDSELVESDSVDSARARVSFVAKPYSSAGLNSAITRVFAAPSAHRGEQPD